MTWAELEPIKRMEPAKKTHHKRTLSATKSKFTNEECTNDEVECYHCGHKFRASSVNAHRARCSKNPLRTVSRQGGRKKKKSDTMSRTTSCEPTNAGDVTVPEQEVVQDDNSDNSIADQLLVQLPIAILKSEDFRISPYQTTFDRLMATFSIQHKCYGGHLNGVYTLLQQIENSSSLPNDSLHSPLKTMKPSVFPTFAARNADKLSEMELKHLHPGLLYEQVKLEIPIFDAASNIFRSSVKDVYLSIRMDMRAVLVEMLTRRGVWEHLHWTFEEKRCNGEREYQGFYTANAWKRLQAEKGPCVRIAGLLLFSDATEILRFSKSSLHPVYICPAGLDFQHMSLKSMTLIGFVPTDTRDIKDTLSSKDQEDLARWNRCMLATAYSLIIMRIHEISTSGGLYFLDDQTNMHHVFPYVITSISDHLEGNNIAMMEMLACRYCTVRKDDYCQPENDQLRPENSRTLTHVQTEISNLDPTTARSESGVDNQDNPLWGDIIRPCDPYMNSHCIFHDIDEGVWKWFLEKIFIPSFKHNKQQSTLIDEITCLTRVPGLKVWSKITTDKTKNLTAKEMRHLLVQVVVVLAALLFHNETYDKMFIAVLDLCNWYELVRSKSTSESTIEEMEKKTIALRSSLRVASENETGEYKTNALKHHVILHYPSLIREFGAMLFQSCEKWDSAHRFIIKAHLTSYGSGDFQSLVQQRVSATNGKCEKNIVLRFVIVEFNIYFF